VCGLAKRVWVGQFVVQGNWSGREGFAGGFLPCGGGGGWLGLVVSGNLDGVVVVERKEGRKSSS